MRHRVLLPPTDRPTAIGLPAQASRGRLLHVVEAAGHDPPFEADVRTDLEEPSTLKPTT